MDIQVHQAACYADCYLLVLTALPLPSVFCPVPFIATAHWGDRMCCENTYSLCCFLPWLFCSNSSCSPIESVSRIFQAICCFILCPIVFEFHRFYVTTVLLCSGYVLEVCCLWSDKYHWPPKSLPENNQN